MKLHHALAVSSFALLVAPACRQDMHDQPKHKPFTESVLFKDHRATRPLVAGTVARGHLDEDDHLFRGKIDGKPAETFPFPVDAAVMARGRDRYQIHCTPCHGALGDGNGMIVQRGLRRPTSFHIERLQKSPPGYFYDVITNGFGAMFDLADRVRTPEDRWAIVAYVRALQQSQNTLYAELDERQRGELEHPTSTTDGGHPNPHEEAGGGHR